MVYFSTEILVYNSTVNYRSYATFSRSAGHIPFLLFYRLFLYGRITTFSRETNAPERLPLLPVTLEIIDRYKNSPYCQLHGKLLPVNSNQRYNAYLKEVAAICGINKHLTTHTARHTFATTVTLEHDVPIETVSQMLGHKSVRTTQIYAKITQRKISNNMKALRNKLFGDEQTFKVKSV